MANGRIRVLSAIPGPTSLSPIVRDFAKRREGTVTAFSDGLLPLCAQLIGEDSLIEVKPFGEIVRQTLEMSGEEVGLIAQQGQCLAAVAQVIGELGEDSPFWKTHAFSGLHESLWSSLKELGEWGIDAEECRRLAANVGSRRGRKLTDLAHVTDRVEEILAVVGRQTHGYQVRACLGGTLEPDGSLDRLLVVAGGEDNPRRIEWIQWLAAGGTDVTIVLDRHATDGSLFDGARQMRERIGEPVTETGDANRLARNLFTTPDHSGAPIDVAIVSAADPLAEVEWALRGCLERGEPSDSAIFARNLDTYAPLIEAASKRLGVPIRMARRAPLLTNAFARLTLTTLQFCASSDVRSIAPIVRSSYLGLAPEQKEELNSQVREAHRKRASQWTTLQTWSTGSISSRIDSGTFDQAPSPAPAGEGGVGVAAKLRRAATPLNSAGEPTEPPYPWLSQVLAWRQDALAADGTLAEWTERLRTLIDVLPWHEELGTAGAYSSDRDRRAQNQLQRVLASYATVNQAIGAGMLTLAGFTQLCERLWTTADVSIPVTESDEGVTVAAGTETLGSVQNLFVLGMLEGVFPRRRREDPILTDEERSEISDLRPGHPRLRTSIDLARAERDEFYRVCAAPLARIVFSYPLTDDERDNIPAYYLDKVRDAVGVVSEGNHRRSELAPPLEACETEADRNLRQALDGDRQMPLPIELNTEAARLAITPQESDAFRPEELRDALRCPFMSVARHRLGRRPKRRGARWYGLRKLPQAASLPIQGSSAEAEAVLISALESELDILYSDVPEWEMQLLASGGRRLVRDWVRREFASRDHWTKDPGSTLMNVGFGSHGLRDTLPGNISLTGVIPAISRMGSTSVLHLYGGAPRDAADLTDSERLYLGVHFLAAHQTGHESAVEIESTGSKRTLYLLNRSGTRPVSAQVQDGLEVKELSEADDPSLSKKIFFDRVKMALRRAMLRISEGHIEATAGEQCDTCDYGELCRRSKAFGEEDSPFGSDEEPGDV